MNNSGLTAILNIVLAAVLLLSAILCVQYVFIAREVRSLSLQAVGINNDRARLQLLANDCLEYSKKNPAIDPILESVKLKEPKVLPAGAAKPASK